MSKEALKKEWEDAHGNVQHWPNQNQNFCQAMCMFWVSLRLKNCSGQALWNRLTSAQVIAQVTALQPKTKPTAIIIGMNSRKMIPGTEMATNGMKFLGVGSLRGRHEVVAKILSERGLYILGSSGPGGGHAIAFDTRTPSLYFMDPNFGQAWFENGGVIHDSFFSNWYRKYWDDTFNANPDSSYKKMFHHGAKNLRSYTLTDANQLPI